MKLSSKNVLVTGGAGFIGSNLVERLLAENPPQIIIVDNLAIGRQGNIPKAKNILFYCQSAADTEGLRQIIERHSVEVVFDLATVCLPVSLERPEYAFKEICELALAAGELCRQGCFKTLIHFSSSEIYGSAEYIPMDEAHPKKPRTVYAAGKLAADNILLSYHKSYGIDLSIVRPFNTFGPRQNERTYAAIIPKTIRRIMQGNAPEIFGSGSQSRDFSFVSDIVDAAVKAYFEKKTRGLALNIATGKETSVNTLVEIILEEMHSSLKPQRLPARPGDVQRHLADISLAKSLIGYKPKTTLREGIRKTIEWYGEVMGNEA